MGKSTKIIIVHLVAQVVVAVIVFAAASKEYEGATLGATGIVIAYSIAAVSSILISLKLMFSFQKQPFTVLLLATFLSVCLWVFGPRLIDQVSHLIPHTSSDAIFEKTVKKPTLKAVEEMGFREYTWDKDSRTCMVKLPDGRQHHLTLNGDYLTICAKVKQPTFTDTIGWMRTTLLEAMVYLKPKNNLILSSCISSKDYDFTVTNTNQVSLKLGSTNPYEPAENWIKGESLIEERYSNTLGNLSISIYYGGQIQKKR